jgi:hypothetical protein
MGADTRERLGRRLALGPLEGGARLEVEPRAERAARAGEHRHPHVLGAVDLSGGLGERFPHFDVEGVQTVGLVERDRGHRRLDLDLNLVHWNLLIPAAEGG